MFLYMFIANRSLREHCRFWVLCGQMLRLRHV